MLKVRIASVIFTALLSTISAPFASGAPVKVARPMKVTFGYCSRSAVAFNIASPCYEATPGAQDDYKSYLEKYSERLKTAAQSQKQPDEIQTEVDDLRLGLDAREKSYGPCPGRCLSYGFSPEFLYAARTLGREKRYDLIVDPQAIYWGSDKVIKNGTDVTSELTEIYKLVRVRMK